MGVPVMVMGDSGSGKSASLRNFSPDEVGVFSVASKPLPFRKKLNVAYRADYAKIEKTLKTNKLKCYVIDDSQYLMAFEEFRKANETGYAKFTTMAVNFYNLLEIIREQTTDDTIVYFLHHTQTDEYGNRRIKTIGKMLDTKLTVEGLFTIVLLAETDGKEHWFTTQSDGTSTAKTPMEMFDTVKIDNDLKAVDKTIRDYYFGGNENGI